MAGDLPYKYVILDESHNIKNPRAQVTKAVHLVLRKARYKAILTASPITNSELDAWAQWYFLDSGTSFGRSYWVFRDQYFIPDRNRWVWTPTMHFKHKFNQVLQKGIILDEDVIDLPSATFSQHYVDLHPKQKKAYHQLEQEFRLYLKNLKEPVIDTQWAVVRFTKMRQILSGFVIDDKKQVHVLPCNKYSQLISILEEELPKHKVVIWCLWSEEIRQVCKVLDAMAISYVKYDGSLDFAQRDSAVRFFQTDPDVRVFVGQVQAGGEAITLTASDRVVYMSQTLSIRYRDQSEGRTRRIGSEKHKHINYTDMLTTDTLETAMYEGIKERRYTNQMLLYRHLLSHVKLSDGGKKRS
jgi:SNF2 family DNA or RNA helicase